MLLFILLAGSLVLRSLMSVSSAPVRSRRTGHLLRDLHSQRHSLLTQINAGNVKTWNCNGFSGAFARKVRSHALVVNGVLYLFRRQRCFALDAVTGRVFWTYRTLRRLHRAPLRRLNRGVAILGTHCSWVLSTRA